MEALVDARDRELRTESTPEPVGELGMRGGDAGRDGIGGDAGCDGGGSLYGSATPASLCTTSDASTSTTTDVALLSLEFPRPFCGRGVRVRILWAPCCTPEARSECELFA